VSGRPHSDYCIPAVYHLSIIQSAPPYLTLNIVVSACRLLAWDAMFNAPKHPGTQIGIHCTCTYRCPNCWTRIGTEKVNGLWNLAHCCTLWSSCFHPFPLCQTSQVSPLLQGRLLAMCKTHLLNMHMTFDS